MKLKGLVWFFTIVLILISLWELSYTWVVRNHENSVKAQAERIVKKTNPELKVGSEDFNTVAGHKRDSMLLATRDKAIYPLLGTTYQKCKENELNLGLDLQGGISVTMDVSLEGLIKSLSNNPKDTGLANALQIATNQRAVNASADYITLFSDTYTKQNGAGKLASLFAGQGKSIKVTASD